MACNRSSGKKQTLCIGDFINGYRGDYRFAANYKIFIIFKDTNLMFSFNVELKLFFTIKSIFTTMWTRSIFS